MIRRPLFFFCLALLVVVGAPIVATGDEDPTPAQVAAWILRGDDADLQRAVRALEGAPSSFLAEVVRALRQGGDPQPVPEAAQPADEEAPTVLVTATLYSVPRGTAAKLLGDERAHGTHVLGEEEAQVLRERLAGAAKAQIVSAPRLLVGDGERGSLSVTSPVSFVREFRVERSGDRRTGDPVVDTIDEGLELDVRPIVSEDRRFVTLEGELRLTTVARPIPTKEVTLEGATEPVEIQLPQVHVAHFGLGITAPDGSTVVRSGLAHATDPERELLALVEARIAGAGTPVSPPAVARDRTLIQVEARVLLVEAEVARRILDAHAPTPDAPFLLLDAAQVVALLGPGRQGARGVTVLTAPRLTTFDGQSANISMLNQTSYVKDYEVQKDGDAVALDPVIETIQDGLVLELTPRIDEDQRGIAVDAEITWADLQRPIGEFEATIEGQQVKIQIPELRVSRVKTETVLPPGGYALFGGLGEGDDVVRFVLLTASVFGLEDVAEEDAVIPR